MSKFLDGFVKITALISLGGYGDLSKLLHVFLGPFAKHANLKLDKDVTEPFIVSLFKDLDTYICRHSKLLNINRLGFLKLNDCL